MGIGGIGKGKSLPLIYADERGSKKATAEGGGATRSSSNLRQSGMVWGVSGIPQGGGGVTNRDIWSSGHRKITLLAVS